MKKKIDFHFAVSRKILVKKQKKFGNQCFITIWIHGSNFTKMAIYPRPRSDWSAWIDPLSHHYHQIKGSTGKRDNEEKKKTDYRGEKKTPGNHLYPVSIPRTAREQHGRSWKPWSEVETTVYRPSQPLKKLVGTHTTSTPKKTNIFLDLFGSSTNYSQDATLHSIIDSRISDESRISTVKWPKQFLLPQRDKNSRENRLVSTKFITTSLPTYHLPTTDRPTAIQHAINFSLNLGK
jgi:hypothetical protein